MATIEELLREGVERLRASGSESPRLDAELLLARAIGADRTAVLAHPAAPVGDGQRATFEADLERRAAGEPVAYIRGFKEFFGLAFSADDRALIPRPETELLVELAEGEVMGRLVAAPRPAGSKPLRIADVGTGSGTIAVALLVTLRRRGATGVRSRHRRGAGGPAPGHGECRRSRRRDRLHFIEADLLPPVCRSARRGPR